MLNRKVLIVAYYWPPNSGPGVQRWLKFSTYLAENGWEPHIYTPENPQYYATDDKLENEIHPNVKVVKTNITEPHNLLKKGGTKKEAISPANAKNSSEIAKFIRGNFFLPDSRFLWIKPSIKFLQNYLKKENINVVITSGPPQSLHLIGYGLKKRLNINWIADFRDPWTKWAKFNQFHVTSIAKFIQTRLEKKVVKSADCVTTVTPSWVQDFQAMGAKKCELLTNGYDEADILSSSTSHQNEKITISYGGTLDDIRDPSNFFSSIINLSKVDHTLENKLEIILMGNISSEIETQIDSSPILSKIVVKKGFIPHKEISKAYIKSDLLLLLLTNLDNIDSVIPGKLFEYLAYQKHILALIPSQGDSAKILSKAKNQTIINYNNQEGIETFLRKIIDNPSIIKPVNDNYHYQFSRKNITLKLIEIMESLNNDK